jgi:hypothetical protein
MAFGNLSPLRLGNIQDPKSFGFNWRSFSGSGRESLSLRFHSIGFQYVQKWQHCTHSYCLRLAIRYLNEAINSKPEMQHWVMEQNGLAKSGKTHGLMGRGPYLASQEATGRVFGQFWNQTTLCFQSKPGLLVGYPDLLLPLAVTYSILTYWSWLYIPQDAPLVFIIIFLTISTIATCTRRGQV